MRGAIAKESVGRFVHDVMTYTLPKCGLPEAEIPTYKCRPNEYISVDFIEMVGTNVLRLSFLIRDALSQMFASRFNSPYHQNENLSDFLARICVYCAKSEKEIEKSYITKPLAVCNEYIMYSYSARIPLDYHLAVATMGCFILIGLKEYFLKTFERLYQPDDGHLCMKLITDVASNLYIIYGPRKNISKLFSEESKTLVASIIESHKSEYLKRTEVSDDSLKGACASAKPEETLDLFQRVKIALESVLNDDSDTYRPATLPVISENIEFQRLEPHGYRWSFPIHSLKPFYPSDTISDIVEIDDIVKLSLGARGTSDESEEESPKAIKYQKRRY